MISKFFIVYFAVVNIISMAVTAYDKFRAVNGKRRVRERTLFLLAFLGGGVFEYITMLVIRHKTQHLSFMIVVPVIILAQLITALLIAVNI